MPYTVQQLNQISNTIQKYLNTCFNGYVKPCDRMDCTQDIMEKIIKRNLEHDESRGTMEAWLNGVVRNHLIDQKRRSKGLVVLFNENIDFGHHLPDEDGRANEELIDEKFSLYETLLSRDTEENQQIIRLYYEQGYSDDEIAEMLGISIKALPMRRLRSRAKMKKHYKF